MSCSHKIMELTAKDIIKIIKAAKDSGIRKLTCGELQLNFAPEEEKIEAPQFTPDQIKNTFLDREKEIKQDLLETMMLEDPVGYEELINSGELRV